MPCLSFDFFMHSLASTITSRPLVRQGRGFSSFQVMILNQSVCLMTTDSAG